MDDTKEIHITTEYITLGQFLKFADIIHEGGEAKRFLAENEILVNGEPVDAFASLCHADRAVMRARTICERLADAIPPQQFKIAIQGAIGGRIIAREDVRQLRKNVLAKCYGGDITRKRKLLDKQREGKKRMKEVGNVNIPQEAFVAVLRSNNDDSK